MRILVTSNIPSPYFVDYINELSKHFNVDVLFERKKAKDRNELWYKDNDNKKIRFIYLKGIKIGPENAFCFGFKKYLRNCDYSRIIIANPTTPTGVREILYCKRNKIKYCLQSEGGFQGNGNGIKERIKKAILSGAVFYLSGMGTDDDYFLKYGATREQIKKYNFSSFKKQDFPCASSLNNKKKYKIDLKFDQKKLLLLSVGRVIPIKGYDFLVKLMAKYDQTIHCVVVGGKPTRKIKKAINKNNVKNIAFIDFVSPQDVAKYYLAADVMIFTTRGDTWGLVINEAMSYGLPIVSSDKSVAARCLIENYKNGFVCKCDDIESFSNSLNILLKNKDLRLKMSKNNLLKIKTYTIEKMGEQISNYLIKDWDN